MGKSVPSDALFTDTNTTYSAGNGLSLSGTTFNHSNSVTAGTASGTTGSVSFGGTISIPSITYDAQGHITSKTTTSVTLPANPNVDTKVTNTANTTTKAYLTGTTSSSTNTGTQIFDTGIYTGTTAGSLYSTTFTASSKITTKDMSITGTLSAPNLFKLGTTQPSGTCIWFNTSA